MFDLHELHHNIVFVFLSMYQLLIIFYFISIISNFQYYHYYHCLHFFSLFIFLYYIYLFFTFFTVQCISSTIFLDYYQKLLVKYEKTKIFAINTIILI